MRLFDLNSPLMVALGKLADIIICNIMFCLFSLPVITIGASLTALYHCMQELIYDDERDEGMIIREFWQAFRQNLGSRLHGKMMIKRQRESKKAEHSQKARRKFRPVSDDLRTADPKQDGNKDPV